MRMCGGHRADLDRKSFIDILGQQKAKWRGVDAAARRRLGMPEMVGLPGAARRRKTARKPRIDA
jgi:hypothetical protein